MKITRLIPIDETVVEYDYEENYDRDSLTEKERLIVQEAMAHFSDGTLRNLSNAINEYLEEE